VPHGVRGVQVFMLAGVISTASESLLQLGSQRNFSFQQQCRGVRLDFCEGAGSRNLREHLPILRIAEKN